MQHDFILLDRSGSMESMWFESITAINAYVMDLAERHVDTRVTLVAFDAVQGDLDFKVLRDAISPTKWETVTDREAKPRGMTPLNDAIGKLVFLANLKAYTRVCLIIMTDGQENMSREDKTGARANKLLAECRKKEWPVIFLGVAYEPKAHAQMAGSYANTEGHTMSASGGQMVNTMRRMSEKRSGYAASGQSATMDWSDEEKAEVVQPPKPKEPDGQGGQG